MRGRGFTLIELLIVIGIIAVLALVVILVMNPVELLRRSRDVNRVSEITTLNTTVRLFSADTGGSLGTAYTTYLSVPDPVATSSAGDQCQGLGLNAPAPGWAYHCAASSTYRNVDGTGWIPLDLTAMSTKSPLGRLPVDPANTTSSGNYYTYVVGSNTADFTATQESQKYIKTSALNDGGYDPGRLELGGDLSLIAQSEGLVGWWPVDEGAGTIAADLSPIGNAAALATMTWLTSGCKLGNCISTAGSGGEQIITAPASIVYDASQITYMAWESVPSFLGNSIRMNSGGNSVSGSWGSNILQTPGDISPWGGTGAFTSYYSNSSLAANAWYHVVITWNDATLQGRIYVNGQRVLGASYPGPIVKGSAKTFFISEYLVGINLDDIRVYNRVLNDPEILKIYNAEN